MTKRVKNSADGRFVAKFDYDSDEWYTAIKSLAMGGFDDGEIGVSIGEKIQEYRAASGGEPLPRHLLEGLDPDTFRMMKEGKYVGWTPEQNEERGGKIRSILQNARLRVNGIIKGAYLRAALGGKKVKNKGTTYRRLKIDGVYTEDEEIQRTETEAELPPNLQAMATWLYHHDPTWRRRQRGLDVESSDVPQDIARGIDIAEWIDREVMERETLEKEKAVEGKGAEDASEP